MNLHAFLKMICYVALPVMLVFVAISWSSKSRIGFIQPGSKPSAFSLNRPQPPKSQAKKTKEGFSRLRLEFVFSDGRTPVSPIQVSLEEYGSNDAESRVHNRSTNQIGVADFGQMKADCYRVSACNKDGFIFHSTINVHPGQPFVHRFICPRLTRQNSSELRINVRWPDFEKRCNLLAICEFTTSDFVSGDSIWRHPLIEKRTYRAGYSNTGMSFSEEQLSSALPSTLSPRLLCGERLEKPLTHERIRVRYDYLEMVEISLLQLRPGSNGNSSVWHLGTVRYSNGLKGSTFNEQYGNDKQLIFDSAQVPRSPHGPTSDWEVVLPDEFVKRIEKQIGSI